MSSGKRSIVVLASFFLVVYLIASPFLPLLTGYGAESGWSDKVILVLSSLWFEVPLLALVIAGVVTLIRRRDFNLTDRLALVYVALAITSYLWTDRTLSYHLIGLRFTLLPFLFYLTARITVWQPAKLASIIRPVAIAVVVLVLGQAFLWSIAPGLLDKLSLGPDFLAGALPRLYGSLGGPNQLAFYLGAVLMLLAITYRQTVKFGAWPLLILAALIPFTASRSVTLALFLGLLFLLMTATAEVKKVVRTTLLVMLASALVWFTFNTLGSNDSGGLIRAESDTIRLETFSLIKQNFLESSPWQWLIGHGAGTAGPATFSAHGAFITENWFLQVAYEYGLAGLMLVGAFGLSLFLGVPRARPLLVYALVVSMFLHSLADAPAGAALIFIALAAMLNSANANSVST